ncbi:Alpha/Beta hydrolase protein [Xylariomycetidae sp. FL0641]|nr:Alpha/Beta hydrolase protein [Xylariomycetidae sp. FL0641]
MQIINRVLLVVGVLTWCPSRSFAKPVCSRAPIATTALAAGNATEKPSVDLGYEIHQGTVNETGNYYAFSNIPYAQQPVGDLRFKKPLAIDQTGSKVNTGSEDLICTQAYPEWMIELFANGGDFNTTRQSLLDAAGQTESCLVLDVRVPVEVFEARTTSKTPVLVWIHGGGFTYGSKVSDGNPSGLLVQAEGNLIVVSMNYRLGLYGWLAGNDTTANLGLYDQRVALEWVQKYISRFGGDPTQVTVMGESAGAASIVHHMTAYGGAEDSLPFQRAIPQSPAFQISLNYDASYNLTMSSATTQSGESVTSVADLANLDAETLASVNQAVVEGASTGAFNYGPIPDGDYVPEYPQVLLYQKKFHQNIEVMTSHTANESVPFTSTSITTTEALHTQIEHNFPEAAEDTIHVMLADIYPDVLNGTYPWTTQFARAAQIATESSFACTTKYLADARDGQSYNYVFAYPPGYHAGDLDYTFYNGEVGLESNGYPVNVDFAKQHQQYIVSFAQTGNPNPASGDLVEFPVYGDGGDTLRLVYEGFKQAEDDVHNSRCDWIQQAMVDGLL